MRYTPKDTVTVGRLRKVVTNWFDFTLDPEDKMTLLHAFPRALVQLSLLYPSLVPLIQDEIDQPNNKDELMLALVYLFLQTSIEPFRRAAESGDDLPKHYLEPELVVFLGTVRITCDTVNYCHPSSIRSST